MASIIVFLVESRARYGANLSIPVIFLLVNALYTEKELPKFHKGSIVGCETNSVAILPRI